MKLEAVGLIKSYGSRRAVDNVSFGVGPGERVGLLGPNGAGKSTTVAMLSGSSRPDRGEVRLDGKPLGTGADPAKRALGLVPQELALYDELNARDNLHLFGSLYGLTRPERQRAIAAALDLVGLAERARDLVRTYSGGMKRRLNLAGALLHDPKLLILDEPTVGVDPQSRNAIFENLEAIRARGVAILYTTHYIEEVERLCDRVVIMDHGRVIADKPLRDLYRQAEALTSLAIELTDAPDDGDDRLESLADIEGVVGVRRERESLWVALERLDVAAAVLGRLDALGCKYVHIKSERPNLESVFLDLTGERLRDP